MLSFYILSIYVAYNTMVSLLLYELVVQLSEHDEVLHRVPQLQLHGVLAHCSRG